MTATAPRKVALVATFFVLLGFSILGYQTFASQSDERASMSTSDELVALFRSRGIELPSGRWDPEPLLWRTDQPLSGTDVVALWTQAATIASETKVWPVISNSFDGTSFVYGSSWGEPEVLDDTTDQDFLDYLNGPYSRIYKPDRLAESGGEVNSGIRTTPLSGDEWILALIPAKSADLVPTILSINTASDTGALSSWIRRFGGVVVSRDSRRGVTVFVTRRPASIEEAERLLDEIEGIEGSLQISGRLTRENKLDHLMTSNQWVLVFD
jgi:hypothetical protein